jgi:hypothetical protein
VRQQIDDGFVSADTAPLMAQVALRNGPFTLTTSFLSIRPTDTIHDQQNVRGQFEGRLQWQAPQRTQSWDLGSTGKGILIGMLSAFGTAALVTLLVAIFYFLRYTSSGRILLDRFGRPGEFDDEQQFLRDEEDALADMDDLQRAEYQRAKGQYKEASNQAETTLTRYFSFRASKSTRVDTNGHFIISISSNTGEGCVGLGVRAGTRDRQLLCGGADRDRVL